MGLKNKNKLYPSVLTFKEPWYSYWYSFILILIIPGIVDSTVLSGEHTHSRRRVDDISCYGHWRQGSIVGVGVEAMDERAASKRCSTIGQRNNNIRE